MKFKFLTGDINWETFGGSFISKKLNNGDWDYWLVLEFTNLEESLGQKMWHKYTVEIKAVSPEAAGMDNLNKAFECIGMDGEEFLEMKTQDRYQVEALHEYGISATLFYKEGNNIKKLMKEAHEEADKIEYLFDFYMDREENRIGNNGWQFISGNLF